jgi:hypothetical protein
MTILLLDDGQIPLPPSLPAHELADAVTTPHTAYSSVLDMKFTRCKN